METPPVARPHRNPFGFILAVPLFAALLLKVLLRKTLLVLFLIGRGVLRYKVSSALVGLLLVALLWTSLHQQTAPVAALAASNTSSVAPPPALQTYIKGQTSFDAALMWTAMSDQLQQAVVSQGGSPEALQQNLEQARTQGRRFKDVTYLTGYRLDDGRAIFLYVLSMEADGDSRQVPYLFTVGKDGKIDRID